MKATAAPSSPLALIPYIPGLARKPQRTAVKRTPSRTATAARTGSASNAIVSEEKFFTKLMHRTVRTIPLYTRILLYTFMYFGNAVLNSRGVALLPYPLLFLLQ